MTPEQRYFLDLSGYLHLRRVLSSDELAAQVQIAGEVEEITLFGGHACSVGAAVDEPAPIYCFSRPDLSQRI